MWFSLGLVPLVSLNFISILHCERPATAQTTVWFLPLRGRTCFSAQVQRQCWQKFAARMETVRDSFCKWYSADFLMGWIPIPNITCASLTLRRGTPGWRSQCCGLLGYFWLRQESVKGKQPNAFCETITHQIHEHESTLIYLKCLESQSRKTNFSRTRIGVPILFQLIFVASLAQIGNQPPYPYRTPYIHELKKSACGRSQEIRPPSESMKKGIPMILGRHELTHTQIHVHVHVHTTCIWSYLHTSMHIFCFSRKSGAYPETSY